MPDLKTYDLFISHAWKYADDYNDVVTMLKDASNFYFRNYSVPIHDPLIDPNTSVGRAKLTSLLNLQVRPVNCVLILSGMYAAHSDWILKEIELAKSYDKPIIGIKPWGQIVVPKAIQENANVIVGWNESSIINAIRQYSL
jgi:hypothetical protein